jgi:hypothetical protein
MSEKFTITKDKWTELHATFKVEKPFGEGWFAYVSCNRANVAFRVDAFRRSLALLLGAAALSTAACLLCKNFDYLRAHIFEVEIHKLLGQIGVFTGLFIPFFCAYGLLCGHGGEW